MEDVEKADKRWRDMVAALPIAEDQKSSLVEAIEDSIDEWRWCAADAMQSTYR